MSQPVCHLEEFYLTRVNVTWVEPPAEVNELDLNLAFDYSVFRHKEDPLRYRLTLRLSSVPQAPDPMGYQMDCEISGFFRFPEDSTEPKREYLIRVNGCTILYGILRGQFAGITGSFPNRPLLLPTVMMEDVVKEIEAKRAASIAEKAPKNTAKKATKKSSKRPK
jgi:preprotein translocase subunit SecB